MGGIGFESLDKMNSFATEKGSIMWKKAKIHVKDGEWQPGYSLNLDLRKADKIRSITNHSSLCKKKEKLKLMKTSMQTCLSVFIFT